MCNSLICAENSYFEILFWLEDFSITILTSSHESTCLNLLINDILSYWHFLIVFSFCTSFIPFMFSGSYCQFLAMPNLRIVRNSYTTLNALLSNVNPPHLTRKEGKMVLFCWPWNNTSIIFICHTYLNVNTFSFTCVGSL